MVDAIPGVLESIKYTLLCMKELDFVMLIMATDGANCTMVGRKSNVSKRIMNNLHSMFQSI